MKKRKISGRLSLHKENIVSLNKVQMNHAKGGEDPDATSVYACYTNEKTRGENKCCNVLPCSPRFIQSVGGA